MADNLQARLQEAGFSPNEAKVYLALLELGPSPVGPIMHATGLYRVITYDVLEKLLQKGLVSYFIRNNRRQFRAESPEKIWEAAKAAQDQARQLSFELSRIQPSSEQKQVLVYEGIAGIKAAQENYFKIMRKGQGEYLMFGASLALHEKLDSFFNYFHERRSKMRVPARLLFNESNRQYGELKKKYPPVKVRYMPSNTITPSWVSIYTDMMLIGVLDEEPFAFFIQNKKVVQSYRDYFELLWKMGKK